MHKAIKSKTDLYHLPLLPMGNTNIFMRHFNHIAQFTNDFFLLYYLCMNVTDLRRSLTNTKAIFESPTNYTNKKYINYK